MKTTLFIAAGATALLTYLFMKKCQSLEVGSAAQTNPKHGDHHVTNVFANAKRHSSPKNV